MNLVKNNLKLEEGNLNLFIDELNNISELDIKSLRCLVLNTNYDNLIDSKIEIGQEVRKLILNIVQSTDKDKINQHIDGINYYIRSLIVYGIRKNPDPKPTPLSAFDFVGHNETDVKQLKNSVQVLAF